MVLSNRFIFIRISGFLTVKGKSKIELVIQRANLTKTPASLQLSRVIPIRVKKIRRLEYLQIVIL
jgi:hypothetical protein